MGGWRLRASNPSSHSYSLSENEVVGERGEQGVFEVTVDGCGRAEEFNGHFGNDDGWRTRMIKVKAEYARVR